MKMPSQRYKSLKGKIRNNFLTILRDEMERIISWKCNYERFLFIPALIPKNCRHVCLLTDIKKNIFKRMKN